jgi:5-deoxy-glucuronate isomerase
MKLHLPAGSTADPPYALALTPEQAGWAYCGLRVLELAPGGSHRLHTGEDEVLVLPLSGSSTVDCAGQRFELAGRADVFSGVSDFAYLPPAAGATVASARGGRFALASARASGRASGQAQRRLPARYVPASDVAVELRGAGSCSREVHNFATPEVFDADRIIACEVLTPSGNWSSYPPHKHDEERPGETALEEIYYFEIAPGPGGAAGVAYQRVYGSADLLAEVRDGDVVLVPHGWHGPSMAVPGYDLYYLNVMAGPGPQRAWLISDDPAHAWVRGTWPDQPVDPRLPWHPPEA